MEDFNMKTELACEHLSHFFLRIVLIVLCGGFLTSFILIAGGGMLAVYVLNAPIGPIHTEIAVVLYGMVTFFLFHGATRCWFLREALNEWESMGQMHRDAVARLKGQPLARARA
ncbi:hypothetical protein WJ96_04190 [Burkholderia ubonensis]|uniref:DUF4282 domain-containing protein n=2 Tax=Burkholderia ubonensis TaxID=101571 RepID=A0AAW3MW08_9BURK|nr:hypothetical protein WJ93_23935 [Burkholderia ubonensis]KVP97775.1 hypothetical protein WJ96_04190 [Burkholderia ubonensis]KVZ92472.1 hypothetical protein WL25_15845 [Burkholderia ubonensis]